MIVKVCDSRGPNRGGVVTDTRRSSDSNLGRSMKGLISYLTGPGKENEHTNPMLVGASSPLGEEYADVAWGDAAGKFDTQEFVRQMNAPMVKKRLDGELPENRAWVFHAVMSAAPGTSHTYEEWGAMAQEYVAQMEFDDGVKAPCRWAAFHHGVSKHGNDHVHIVVQMIREDGTWASNHRSKVRSQEARKVLEKKFNLTPVELAARERGSIDYTQEEARRAGSESETERETLRRRMIAALHQSRSEAEYVRNLWKAGVLTRPWFAQGTTDVVKGYRVALRPGEGEEPRFFGAGKVDKALTLPAVRAQFEDTPEAALEAAKMWRTLGGDVPGPKRVTVDPEAPERAAHVLRRETQRWQRAHTPATVFPSQLSRGLSGLLAVTANQLEPRGRGPLSRAMGSLWHDSSHATVMRPLSTGEAVGQAGRLLARASSDNTVVGWLAVLEQMHRASQALEAMYEARNNRVAAQIVHRTVTEHIAASYADHGGSPGMLPSGRAATMTRPTGDCRSQTHETGQSQPER